ncbi:Uncharacterised protein [Vibrio cholerae]|nr:Uncharacterised protein [Vibrio cholerae]CSD39646.1 Uncharacterised protein [Vibrio cholerae]
MDRNKWTYLFRFNYTSFRFVTLIVFYNVETKYTTEKAHNS